MPLRSSSVLPALLLASACSRAPAPRAPVAGVSAAPDTAGAGAEAGPDATPGAPLAWADLGPGSFARARAENRFVVIDGSAEWCHWCHVMEATTYHDPAVRKLLDARFVAVKVDVDSRPDFEERYQDWGWPATVLMTADGREIGKYKGYLAPEQFAEILQAVVQAVPGGAPGADAAGESAATGADLGPEGATRFASTQLEEYWDPAQGSWGHQQKVPLFWGNAWALAKARAGDAEARRRVLFTLDRQRAIVDPVWGGICQYSTNGDWLHPHFEKLMAYQAGAIDNYATAYALTGDEGWLRTAQAVRGFVDRFLRGPDGGFYATMDADLNAHEPGKRFVSGHDYFAKTDGERVALGIPRVDTSEYPRENGEAIAAYVSLGGQGHDPTALAAARRAAARILSTHTSERGGLTHAAGDEGRVLYLADNASMGLSLVRLYEATHEHEHLDAAGRIADFLLASLQDERGGFFASTPDPNAVGVFALRRKPFEDNVAAIRFLARLERVQHTDARGTALRKALAALRTKDGIESRGRMIGDFLLAMDETSAW